MASFPLSAVTFLDLVSFLVDILHRPSGYREMKILRKELMAKEIRRGEREPEIFKEASGPVKLG